MLDPELLRKDFDAVAANLRRRGVVLDLAEFDQLEKRRKTAQTMGEALRAERNEGARLIGDLRGKIRKLETSRRETLVALDRAESEFKELKTASGKKKTQTKAIKNYSLPDGKGPVIAMPKEHENHAHETYSIAELSERVEQLETDQANASREIAQAKANHKQFSLTYFNHMEKIIEDIEVSVKSLKDELKKNKKTGKEEVNFDNDMKKTIKKLESTLRKFPQAIEKAKVEFEQYCEKEFRKLNSDLKEQESKTKSLKNRLHDAEEAMNVALREMEKYLLMLPNLLHISVPDGTDESANAEVRTWREPRQFDFEPQDHVALGRNLGMDFDAAADMAGARFVVLSGDLARLHRALAQFMLDMHVREHGYTEHYMPHLANEQAMRGAGQLPKFKDEVFVAERDGFYLIPTAEVVLANLARDCILEAGILPLRWTAHTACFRREAGAHGRDTRGMLRQHQFDKVELVQIASPQNSYKALDEMTRHAENILRRLALPYRIMSLCGGDIGFAAAKTYDLEVWLPGQNCYREISSCSNCESFQARRMKTRVRTAGGGKPEYAHTLNGSGVAVGRALIAVMENHQQKDGSICIPEPLVPYMGDAKAIVPAKKN